MTAKSKKKPQRSNVEALDAGSTLTTGKNSVDHATAVMSDEQPIFPFGTPTAGGVEWFNNPDIPSQVIRDMFMNMWTRLDEINLRAHLLLKRVDKIKVDDTPAFENIRDLASVRDTVYSLKSMLDLALEKRKLGEDAKDRQIQALSYHVQELSRQLSEKSDASCLMPAS